MMTVYKNHYTLTGTVALTLALAGCVSSDPVRLEADFGNSVNQFTQAQTYNPDAAASTRPVEQMDGEMAMGTLDALRKDVSRVEDVGGEIQTISTEFGN